MPTPRHTSSEQLSLQGKNIVITGGTTGIGRAILLLLVERGANVLICGRHKKDMDDALRDAGDNASGVLADMSSKRDVEKLFKQIDKRFARLDAFICNAALPAEGVTAMKPDNIDYVLQTNILGYLLCSREAAARMKKRKAGHVIHIGSISADTRGGKSSVYVTTKSAIQGFSEAFAEEVADMGIRVTLIEPGRVSSDMQPKPRTHPKQEKEKKMLKAEDIAECVKYCLIQPPRCDVSIVQIRPHFQD